MRCMMVVDSAHPPRNLGQSHSVSGLDIYKMSLGSLAAYAPDSDTDHDDDHDHDQKFSGSDDELHARAAKLPRLAEIIDQDSRPSSVTSQSSRPDSKKLSRLVSYGADELATDDEEEEMDLVQSESEETPITETVSAEQMGLSSRNELHQLTDEILIPPEPPGRCSRHLQDKINKFYEKMRSGQDLNRKIQHRKDFRNPSIYEKLIQFCSIDEKGTNYPPEIYNPKIFGKESFYDELAKVQKLEMEKREKERKDKTKIEFVTGVSKRPGSAQGQAIPERKSKWDALPTVQRSASATTLQQQGGTSKPTVISAVGTIKKK